MPDGGPGEGRRTDRQAGPWPGHPKAKSASSFLDATLENTCRRQHPRRAFPRSIVSIILASRFAGRNAREIFLILLLSFPPGRGNACPGHFLASAIYGFGNAPGMLLLPEKRHWSSALRERQRGRARARAGRGESGEILRVIVRL